jgi:hypothetical protein
MKINFEKISELNLMMIVFFCLFIVCITAIISLSYELTFKF